MAPSIKLVSKSTSTSMSCWGCNGQFNVHELVRVYAKSCDDNESSSSREVCGCCLAGYHIPVLRPSTGRWELGTVLAYNPFRSRMDECHHQYQVKFANGAKEWVSVRADPFEAYAQHFDEILEAGRSRKRKAESYFQEEVQEPLPDLVNVMIKSHQLENLCDQDQDLYPYPIEATEAYNFYDDIQVSSFDSSEDHFFFAHPAQERVYETDKISFIDFSPNQRARVNTTSNRVYDSPNDRKEYAIKGDGHGSPISSHISSLSTTSPTSLSSSSCRNNSGSSSLSPHRIPRLWTPKEDKLLLDTIAENNNRLTWPKIALDIPGRTGKQCRERYLNHLGPHLKHSGWTALEDATIFRLYGIYGSKWSQIVKSLPGRTDNGIKNRFHHLRRRFEKRMRSIPNSKELSMLIKQMGKSSTFQNLSPDWFVTRDIATRILNESSHGKTKKESSLLGDGEYKFGPFDEVAKSVGCRRCGLIVPSKETGTTICRQTGWCETCTGMTLAISDDLLRAIHLLRKDEEETAMRSKASQREHRWCD